MQKGAHIKSARRCDLSQDAHTCVTNTRTEKQMTGPQMCFFPRSTRKPPPGLPPDAIMSPALYFI